MPIIAEFFVADHADALAYEERTIERPELKEDYAPAVYYRVHSLHLGNLWALLEGARWNVRKHSLTDIEMGETWLEQFPDGFLSLLAGIDEGTIEEIATNWMESGEGPYEVQNDTNDLVADLRRLAIDSRNRGQGMYLWGCV